MQYRHNIDTILRKVWQFIQKQYIYGLHYLPSVRREIKWYSMTNSIYEGTQWSHLLRQPKENLIYYMKKKVFFSNSDCKTLTEALLFIAIVGKSFKGRDMMQLMWAGFLSGRPVYAALLWRTLILYSLNINLKLLTFQKAN